MLHNVKDFDVECQCVLVQLRDALKMGCHASATVTKKTRQRVSRRSWRNHMS
jgi:hypothetical protein